MKHKPYTIKIELVRGCTMRCSHCALPEMEWSNSKWQFMEQKTFSKIVDAVANFTPKVRIEFAERGEPSFHPRIIEFIQEARESLPMAQMLLTSNTDNIKKFHGNWEAYVIWIKTLFGSGLNIAMLDAYSSDRWKGLNNAFKDISGIEVKDFYKDNTHPYTYHSPKFQQIILVNGTPKHTNAIRHFQNMGGNVNVAKARKDRFEVLDCSSPLIKSCARPFREIVFHYDGNVPLCCNDWKEETIIANIHSENNLEKIWEKFDPYRRHLILKERNKIAPCYKCSERSGFRIGLEKWLWDNQAPISSPRQNKNIRMFFNEKNSGRS